MCAECSWSFVCVCRYFFDRIQTVPARVLKLLLEDTISMMGVSGFASEEELEMSAMLEMEMEQTEYPS